MANIFPTRLIDSVNGETGIVKVIALRNTSVDNINPYIINFLDQDDNIITSQSLSINNIKDLGLELNQKVNVTEFENSLLNIDNKLLEKSKEVLVRIIKISKNSLPLNYTKTDIKNYLNTNGFSVSKDEWITVEVIEGEVILTCEVNIKTPVEGQEIAGDVNIAWNILNCETINITSPVEGEEITGDININFELN